MSSAVVELLAKTPVLPQFPDYGIGILESRHVHGFEMTESTYDFCEVMLILGGKGGIKRGQVRHPVGHGDVLVVPAGTAYFFEDSPAAPLAMLCLCIRPASYLKPLFEAILPRNFEVIRHAAFSREVATHLRAILYEQSNAVTCSPTLVIAQTLLLLDKIDHRSQPQKPRADKSMTNEEIDLLVHVRDYVSKLNYTFHESENLGSAANRLGMSPRSLSYYFRKITGTSRLKYIQDLRLQHACRLLSETEQSVTSIAFACGFEDLSNFFLAFRRYKKLSPSQWREQAHRADGFKS